MTRNGRAYRQRLWVPAINGTAGGALPTPVAQTGAGGPVNSRGNIEGNRFPNLETVIGQMLPTPNAGLFNDGESPDSWMARRKRIKAKGINGNGMGMPLSIAAQLLPTPKAGDGERGRDKARARPDTKGRELVTVVRDQMLPTPRTCSAMAAPVNSRGNLEGDRFPNLETVIGRQLLTPTANDWKGRTNWEAAERHGPQQLPDCLPTGAATYLNPSFVEEMMGFPVGWTA